MKALAPAKVNLCLFLGPVRDDGRHELVTLFESVSLADVLEVRPADHDQVVCPGVDGPNLAEQALAALRAAGWGGPPVRIEIIKRIPVAAGLGGGSADAAATLRLADAIEPLPDGVAVEIARRLGADVPSQLEPGLWIGTGAGEAVERREPLAPHAVVIVPQPFPLSTAEVYREADRLRLPRSPDELAERRQAVEAAVRPGVRLPNALAMNDLGRAAVSLEPVVLDALAALRDAGAEQILVAGSGPTAPGLWWGDDAAARAARGAAGLAARYPGACVGTPVEENSAVPSPASGTIPGTR